MKVHGIYLTIIGMVAFVAWLAMHEAGVRREALLRHTADSLAARSREIQVAADSALARRDSESVHEQQSMARIGREAARVRQDAAQQAISASILRGRLSDSLKASFDSLEASHARVESSLTAQRDSALALLSGAQASRDTLASLLRQSQALAAGYQGALRAALRKPFFDRTIPRVLMLVAAAKVGGLLKL